MIGYRDFLAATRELGLGDESRVIVHASLSAFGHVSGDAEAVVGALLAACKSVMMPTFTYQTMITPDTGPAHNGMRYGSAEERNAAAEFFHPDLPADRTIGQVAEALRKHPQAKRSSHPILSFAGVNVETGLQAQTLDSPLAPLEWLAEMDGDVLLMGVSHKANTSLHYVEKLAGRKQFVRWALTPSGVVACPGWPGCSDGFPSIAPRLQGVSRQVELGPSQIEAVPLRDLIHIAGGWLREDPEALLCDNRECQRCAAVRTAIGIS
ncbi:MAG: AAC(3) family N-acetyltransferase [Anaerolineales bacterium]|jgi:aminoglycoside 3-N-acetyltransferase